MFHEEPETNDVKEIANSLRDAINYRISVARQIEMDITRPKSNIVGQDRVDLEEVAKAHREQAEKYSRILGYLDSGKLWK